MPKTSIIRGPHVTEKASHQTGVYAFVVDRSANKIEVRRAIEQLYSVGVAGVRVVNVPEKHRRVGRFEGKKSGYKKALVTLRSGDTMKLS